MKQKYLISGELSYKSLPDFFRKNQPSPKAKKNHTNLFAVSVRVIVDYAMLKSIKKLK
jgi:hypothetical protein